MPASQKAPEALRAEDVEGWLAQLELTPLARVDRDGITSWDLDLDGRRRFDIRVTLILDPGLGLICWAHYAPPIGDRFRASYRRLLRWNDEFPFVKFAVAEDERPVLAAELAADELDRDKLGLALARLATIADALLEESAGWLWLNGEIPADYATRTSRNDALLARYAPQLREFAS
jgi:hypothetical protein